jgi:hypothetical protein
MQRSAWSADELPGLDDRNENPPFSSGFKDGSDGTRTRDLRRDRPAAEDPDADPMITIDPD